MSNPAAFDPASIPSVIVVDPRFDAHGPLAAALANPAGSGFLTVKVGIGAAMIAVAVLMMG